MSLIASLALAFAFDNPAITTFQQVWVALMMALLVTRAIDVCYWHIHHEKPTFNFQLARWRFITAASATAIMWGTYGACTVAYLSPLELSVLVAILAAMAGGATTVLAAERNLASAYALTLLIPPSIQATLTDDSLRQWLGWLGFAFAAVMFISARKVGSYTRDAIKLKNQNTDLLAEMAAEKQAVKNANAHLEHKVRLRTDKIYELSNLDPLTGLLNRVAFTNKTAQLLDSAKANDSKMALLFVDLDGFKGINDALGHHVGDGVLSQVAERLRQALKSTDAIICRWGGDEFLVALPEVDELASTLIARNLIERLCHGYQLDLHTLTVGATIGVALYPDHGDTEDQLIRLADMAMYVQKRRLKSAVRVFSQELKGELVREQIIRDGLAQAIANNELSLAFQPIVDAGHHKVVTIEALLRWSHKGELVSPDEFIAIAERHGLIHRLGDWVLNQACQFAAKQLDPSLAICINVSMLELMREDYIEQVRHALSRHKLEPNRLHLEITESVFMQESDVIASNLGKLSTMGVPIAIDDFGTGFSSLSLLQSLSVDCVKIDRSFLHTYHSGGNAIIQATLHIAKEFNYLVVMEGVETEAQATLVLQLGQQLQQGYFHAKPMAAPALINWLRQYRQSSTECSGSPQKSDATILGRSRHH